MLLSFFNSLDFVILGLAAASFLMTISIIKKFGGGTLGKIFYFFAAGALFFGLAELFLFMNDWEVFDMSDISLHLSWHLIFYFSMICFILGGKKLHYFALGKPAVFGVAEKSFLGIFGLITIFLFLFSDFTNGALTPLFEGTVVDQWGLHHLLAFIFASIAAYYFTTIEKDWGKLFGVAIVSILFFLVLVGLQHLWEALVENIKIIPVEGTTAEIVEKIILAPALVLLLFAFYRIKSQISQTK